MNNFTHEYVTENNAVWVVGCDPGPINTALVCVSLKKSSVPLLVCAEYVPNKRIYDPAFKWPTIRVPGALYFACEECGMRKGVSPGADAWETAEMVGELRRLMRSYVDGSYFFRPADWRYYLCGRGNAETAAIYGETQLLFPKPDTKASDPWKGNSKLHGPLWGLHAAGAGGNMEHMKDALGVALAMTRCEYRTGKTVEIHRRPW